MKTELSRIQEVAITAAIEASAEVLGFWPAPTNSEFDVHKTLGVEYKAAGIGNFVTAADHAAGAKIREVIGRYPELESARFRTEESAPETGQASGPWWNIDEIDGTANFARGSEHFGISIGYHLADDTPAVGIIAYPARRQLIVAREGSARLIDFDGRELVDLGAQAKKLPVDPAAKDLFVAYDLGYSDRVEQLEAGAVKLVDHVSAAKVYHCSCYALGEVARGTIDAFFTRSPTIYDIGASAAIIQAIGGKVSDIDGRPIDWNTPKRMFLAARTPEIHTRVLALLGA